MDVIGVWKIAKVMERDDDMNIIWRDVQELLNDPETDESDKKNYLATIKFEADGTLKTFMEIPEGVSQEDLDAAIAEGDIAIEDGKMLVDTTDWKEENGKILINTKIEGEILGEAVNPYEPIEEVDGLIEFTAFRYERA